MWITDRARAFGSTADRGIPYDQRATAITSEKKIGVRHTAYVDPIGRKSPDLRIMSNSPESARGQEVDRVDDRHGDDVFLGAKVE